MMIFSYFDFLFAFVGFIVVASIYWYSSIPKNLPPGPLGLPFVGNALQHLDGTKQHLVLQKFVKLYGPIFKLYIGNQLVVVLGTFEAIQEALVKQGDVFAARPTIFIEAPQKYRGYGIGFSEGERWKEQRRFASSALRDFGAGRPIIEPKIKEEVEHLTSRLNEYASNAQPFQPHRWIACAVTNVTSQFLFGKRFNYDDHVLVGHLMSMARRLAGISYLSPFMYSKVMAFLLGFLPSVKFTKKALDEFIEYVETHKNKTVSTYDPEMEPENFIHAFLKTASNANGPSYFDDIQLSVTCKDLFDGGSGTIVSTLSWAVLYLSQHPDIQEKLYHEIKEQVGTSVLPSYAEKVKLPFAEAVIMETQRLCNLFPMGATRRSMDATKVMGYNIPKDTVIIPLLTNIFYNPELYPDPFKFDPCRFLEANGKVIKDSKLIPFQIGKRVCLAEPLARMELFLILVGLICRYRFYFPADKPPPSGPPIVGFLRIPEPYEVCISAREL